MSISAPSSSKTSSPSSTGPRTPSASPQSKSASSSVASSSAPASKSKSAGVGGSASVSSSSPVLDSPVDRADLSNEDDGPVRDSVSNLLGFLNEDAAPGAGLQSARSTGELGAEAAEANANPYEGFSDNSVSVKAEAWSSDRTPAEGQVARNDHLEGMLRNQGYEPGEIYKKDADGRTLMDRVAEANGLQDPNLIHPDQDLVLPTRHEVAVAEAEAATTADDSPAVAEAVAETKVDSIEDGMAAAEADATARTEGDRSPAEASAEARVEVGEAENAEVEAEAAATAETLGDHSPAVAEAEAETKVDSLEDGRAAAEADATAQTEGDSSDAGALAEASVEVGEAENAEVEAEAAATSTATGDDSDAMAIATTDLAVEKAEDTVVRTDASAEAHSSQGAADALAASTVEIEEAKGLEIATHTEALAAAPEVDSTPPVSDFAAPAELAASPAELETRTPQLPQTEAQPEETPEAPAADPVFIQAETTGTIEDASGVFIEETVEANKDGGHADQDLTIEDNRGTATLVQTVDAVASEAEVLGSGTSSEQDADFAGDGTMVLGQESDAAVAEQRVENHEVRFDPFNGTRFDDDDRTFVEQVVSEGDNSDQSATGIRNVRQVADDREFAGMGSDAQHARYEGAENGELNIRHTGLDGTVAVEVESDKVFFQDGEDMGPRMGLPTGNRVAADIVSDEVRMNMDRSESFNGRIQGSNEAADSHYDLKLPDPDTITSEGRVPRTGDENNVVIDGAGGNDFVGLTGGAGNVLASKTEGELKMFFQPEAAANTQLALDAGQAALTGFVDLRNVENANVQIRGGSPDSDAEFLAGSGANDTVVVHLAEGQEPGAMKYEGFENVVYVRNGEVVEGAGRGNQEFEDFDLVAARIAEAAARG